MEQMQILGIGLGLGIFTVSSANLVPRPPARITHFMSLFLTFLHNYCVALISFHCHGSSTVRRTFRANFRA